MSIKHKSYEEVMAEPLPNSKDFGYDGDYDEFDRSEGYYRWQIAMCEWSIRRHEAELERHGGGESEYAAYVRRSSASAIRYERDLIAKYTDRIDSMKGAA